ncbi:MAG: DUF4040 domain-containing protein [Acidobacteria bacterium]|nr:DUF4040 domain-containing protein [Acidobacteriota bacterium]
MLMLQMTILVLVAATALGVVLTREPASQAIAVSFYGILLAVMFFVFQAPDVALSQIVIGAVALPLMILLGLAKVRRNALMQQRKREAAARERNAA